MSSILEFAKANGIIPYSGTLYKYVNIDTAKLILKNSTLKFSTADEFNDPFELTTQGIDYSISKKEAKELIKRMSQEKYNSRKERRADEREKLKKRNEVVEKMPSLINELRNQFGICCFSKRYDQTLMWSHYADSHYGICLGFKNLFYSEGLLVLSVQYIESIDKISLWQERYELLLKLVFRKSHVWSYEEEVRVLNLDKHGLLPFQKTALTEIHYGLKTKEDDLNEIEDLLKSKNHNVKSYNMVINPKTYDIRRNEYKSLI